MKVHFFREGTKEDNEINRYKAEGYDLELIKRTQFQGNIVIEDDYIRLGDGFSCCMHVYSYPSQNMRDNWAIPLVSQPYTITISDVGTQDVEESKELLARATSESKTQYKSGGKEDENEEAKTSYFSQRRLLEKIISEGEVVKMLHFRIYVYAPSIELLEERMEDIRLKLQQKNFRASAYTLGEQRFEYQAMLKPYSKQEYLANNRKGEPVSSTDLGGSYWFDHVSLEDPTGELLGFTNTNGIVLFDQHTRSNRRVTSNTFITGNSQYGKSTLAKKLNDSNYARLNFVRNFDAHSEYRTLTKNHGGLILSLDGSEGTVNIFQVFPTVIKNNGDVDEVQSFEHFVQKMRNVFNFKYPSVSDSTLNLHDKFITDFFIEEGMYLRNAKDRASEIAITRFPDEQYPICSDFILFLQSKLREFRSEGADSSEIREINEMIRVYENMAYNSPEIFNSHTDIPDFETIQDVTFDYSSLLEGDNATFQAQIYNFLDLVRAHAIKNGKRQRKLIADGVIKREEAQMYTINFDECQNIINPAFPFGAGYVAKITEEMAKYFCCVNLTTPSINNIVPTDTRNDNPYLIAVRKIFSLTQYRFFFNIDNNDVPKVKNALGDSITENELAILPRLPKKQCFMNIRGDMNIVFNVFASKDELKLFDN
ncbi:hypothetical protein P7D73_18195 [Enterococcus raffinosus]|uniref:hypothetical protein n=1 Tax=Enterococcus raffinosus TaxID=71452 RepID=UPI00288C9625|nr:hypothetical protein [Enterococcus raffinosus]MDT2525138.1 hypothetical protein [Enterococcus raffinosus]MDT2592493.1 hypothetical protein [Enterococcus raffinosus]